MTYCDPDPCPCPTPDPHFKLEAVVVCDKYHDFLRCTLPHNKYIFDKLVVVTSHEDKQTQRVCEFYHVECVTTDVLNSRKNVFCKGEGINEGLAKLSLDNWVVHMDADIWLPPQTRSLIERANLAKSVIYGIDRFIVKGFREWEKFLELPKLQHEASAYIHMTAFPLGTRVMQEHAGGWVPIGFFQMWNPKCSGVDKYPEKHTDAGRTDLQFAMKWKRGMRSLIPEVIGYHLESLDAGYGTNWSGRKTATFSMDEEVKA